MCDVWCVCVVRIEWAYQFNETVHQDSEKKKRYQQAGPHQIANKFRGIKKKYVHVMYKADAIGMDANKISIQQQTNKTNAAKRREIQQ